MANAFRFCVEVPLLACAVFSERVIRTISNGINRVVLLIGTTSWLNVGATPATTSLLAAGGVFICFLTGFSQAVISGGDVKLIAAPAVGFTPMPSLTFVQATALTGGVFADGYLVARRSLRPAVLCPQVSLLRRTAVIEARRITHHAARPHATAITCGGVVALLGA